MYSNELYHHGIKGQKWGVRRYQNKDGSLTAAGKKREKSSNLKDKAKKAYNNRIDRLADAYAKDEMYAGKSKKELREEARKDVNAEIAVAVLAAASVTTIAAIKGYRKYRYNVDTIVAKDTELQRIKRNTGTDLHDVFYAADKKGDKIKYAGLYGNQIRMFGDQPAKMKINVNKDLKIAGNKKGLNIYNELYKNDPNFARAYGPGKKGYELFNTNELLGTNSKGHSGKKFIDALKKEGYSGIKDVNDMKNSGYNAANPVIYFNTGKEFTVKTIRKLDNAEVNKSMAKAYAKMIPDDILKKIAISSSSVAIITTASNSAAIANGKEKEKQNGR